VYIDNTQLVYLRRCNNIQYTHFTLQWESVLTSQIVAYWTQWHWSEVCHPMINVIISNVSVVQSGFIGVQRRDVPCSSLASKLLLISLAWLWLYLQMTCSIFIDLTPKLLLSHHICYTSKLHVLLYVHVVTVCDIYIHCILLAAVSDVWIWAVVGDAMIEWWTFRCCFHCLVSWTVHYKLSHLSQRLSAILSGMCNDGCDGCLSSLILINAKNCLLRLM